MNVSAKTILGIDPGTQLMGYCIIQVQGPALQMKVMDVLKLNPKQNNYTRLQVIYNKVEELIRLHEPDCFAIEAPFFGKNVQSMLKLGRAQGVAIAAAIAAGLPVCEYSPKKVKQSITGNGNADKQQVWKMLQQIMKLQEFAIQYFDASDALAVAVCHHYQERTPAVKIGQKSSGWKQYVSLHPEKVLKQRV